MHDLTLLNDRQWEKLRLPNGQSKQANNLRGFFSGGEETRSRLLDANTDPGCAR
jgi:hypothetical protein